MASEQQTTPYRAWLRVIAEFPDWRSDLQVKLDFFSGWRIANAR